MPVILFSVAGHPPIVGNVIEDSGDFISVEYPVIFLKESPHPHIYTFPFMPLADKGIVHFNIENIISISTVMEEIEKHYNDVVVDIKKQKISFIKQSSNSEDVEISDMKFKTVH